MSVVSDGGGGGLSYSTLAKGIAIGIGISGLAYVIYRRWLSSSSSASSSVGTGRGGIGASKSKSYGSTDHSDLAASAERSRSVIIDPTRLSFIAGASSDHHLQAVISIAETVTYTGAYHKLLGADLQKKCMEPSFTIKRLRFQIDSDRRARILLASISTTPVSAGAGDVKSAAAKSEQFVAFSIWYPHPSSASDSSAAAPAATGNGTDSKSHPQHESSSPPVSATDDVAGYIRSFFVLPAYHGSGVAQQLMTATIDDMRKHLNLPTTSTANAAVDPAHTPLLAVHLKVLADNTAAQRFYHKCGFRIDQKFGAQPIEGWIRPADAASGVQPQQLANNWMTFITLFRSPPPSK